MSKLYCATVITALITLLTVFLANVGHTEYKSQIRKRKAKKNALVIPEAALVTSEEYIPETEPRLRLTATSGKPVAAPKMDTKKVKKTVSHNV